MRGRATSVVAPVLTFFTGHVSGAPNVIAPRNAKLACATRSSADMRSWTVATWVSTSVMAWSDVWCNEAVVSLSMSPPACRDRPDTCQPPMAVSSTAVRTTEPAPVATS